RLKLQAAPVRLDIIREEENITDGDVDEFLRWATELGLGYIRSTEGKASRIACIATRVAPDANPAKTLAEHFCQPRWLKGPLNRPGDFEVHAHKRFRLDELFDINSWFRCKTGSLKQGEGE